MALYDALEVEPSRIYSLPAIYDGEKGLLAYNRTTQATSLLTSLPLTPLPPLPLTSPPSHLSPATAKSGI